MTNITCTGFEFAIIPVTNIPPDDDLRRASLPPLGFFLPLRAGQDGGGLFKARGPCTEVRSMPGLKQPYVSRDIPAISIRISSGVLGRRRDLTYDFCTGIFIRCRY